MDSQLGGCDNKPSTITIEQTYEDSENKRVAYIAEANTSPSSLKISSTFNINPNDAFPVRKTPHRLWTDDPVVSSDADLLAVSTEHPGCAWDFRLAKPGTATDVLEGHAHEAGAATPGLALLDTRLGAQHVA
ncbi:hypothetical protein ElyMa_001282500 [Elysia marginata]|uniref:Uncharacterized protein n=1 Tax=Elysia marginata TaxID=1093978 RepID=A0AAV4IJ83_9GAST|nr:hypothetical protein ElyMa_001282500 [Elysia marginata]